MNEPGIPGNESGELSEGLLGYLPSILIQRRWFILIPLIVCALAGVALAFVLPAKYKSSATVVVESKDLPDEIAAASVDDVIDQRIAKIKQQIFSRPELIDLIQTNGLYVQQRRSKPLSKIIDVMREATTITPVSADIDRNPGRGGSTTVAFQISFTYSDPAKAQAVTQQFTEKLLKLDSTQLSDQASSTVRFLSDQAAEVQKQIAELEAQIAGIKTHNGLALSRVGGFIQSTGGYDVQIAGLQRENTELSSRLGSAGSGGDERIAAAEAGLAAAQAVYSDNHPDVIAARQKLVEARALAKAGNGRPATNPVISAQIAANNRSIAALTAAKNSENNRTSAAISASAAAPMIEESISQIQAKADGLRTNYNRISANLLAAQAAQRMETEQKGERLVLVDPPTVPDSPTSPNRPALMIGGIMGGLAIGLAIALAIELFLKPIRGAIALQNMLGVGPLVVIPTLKPGAKAKKGLAKRSRFAVKRKAARA